MCSLLVDILTPLFGEYSAPVCDSFFFYCEGVVLSFVQHSSYEDFFTFSINGDWPAWVVIDWPWFAGVFLFVLTLVSVFKLIGGVLGGR